MGENNRALSLKSLLITVVMCITTVALLLSTGITLYSQITTYKENIVSEVKTLAELVGNSSGEMLLQDDNIREEQALSTLEAASFVQNLHIYKQNLDGELAFFASYNKTGQAPIPSMTHRLEELSKPKFSEDILEIITPIYRQQDLIGYTYVRASTESLNSLIINTVLIAVSVLLVALLLSLALTLRMQRSVTDPIQDLVSIVQHVAGQKDYRLRADHSSLKELDILAKAFNQMLERIQQHIKAQEEAEDEYRRLNLSLEEKVSSRTTALKEANKELIETLEKLHQFQRQIVQNEKMASLGDMVAGVAHEVNTPIGLGVTASTMMLDRLSQLEKDFNAKQLKASSLAKFIQEGEENLNIIYRNLNRAAELISSFKQVAVDQTSENTRVFRFTQLMDEILMSMRPKLKKVKHDINLHCDDNLTIESKAGPINQVMINLIMNSLIHGFEFIDHGQIDIDVSLDKGNQLTIVYKDNGKGIPEEMCKRIFDPFVTTKRGQGGSGLGLHLVYNLITQALNGSISVSSEEGEGVEFVIRFPVTPKTDM
ncbi:Histidine kinase [Saliniradius amylolyticus]|uniref:histidine kinase n=1 Tax=Saliniradius amylolyticus TaxID=2183582 RepID=A0A2S2DZJ7_9ALTE|nr:HAMP domain-containing sensor histidine kinase [Saliniradius amylolyticus]AWL10806.1 Histidine kinase [Saliniradius amylolyticus]